MKKGFPTIFILILLFFTLSITLSCTNKTSIERDIRFPRVAEVSFEASPFFLYISTEEEINDYLLFAGYLADLESGKIEVTADQIDDLFSEMYNFDNLHSLTFEAFLVQVQNEDVRTYILNALDSNKIDPEFKTAITSKYNALVEKSVKKDGKEFLRYNYNNKIFDENINLFSLSETTFFDGGLGVFLHQNNWQSMGFSPEPNVQSFVLGTGGETNSLAENFREFSYIDFDDFLKVTQTSIYQEKYENWEIVDLEGEGILQRTNADKIIIGCGSGPEKANGVESAAFALWLYNSKLKKGYEISYYINYSDKNLSYKLRTRQANLLLFNLLFSYMQ